MFDSRGHFFWPVNVHHSFIYYYVKDIVKGSVFVQAFGCEQLHLLGGK
jgi:hypothetical protein